jgi:hypothetical protein
MPLFAKDVRSAAVRPLGEACVPTIDEKTLPRQVHDDSSLAFHLMQGRSPRARALHGRVAALVTRSDG